VIAGNWVLGAGFSNLFFVGVVINKLNGITFKRMKALLFKQE